MVIVGNEEDLRKKVERTKFCLVRAINDSELQQLVQEGPESFVMNYGTMYESGYGPYVYVCARNRTGTIILCDGFGHYDDRFEILERGAYRCLKPIRTSVDVFNINGLSWNQLGLARTEEKPIDKIVKSFLSSQNIYDKLKD